jgi:ppGpp synthetase/RelA/SpoT-type nucleotidyltranferase
MNSTLDTFLHVFENQELARYAFTISNKLQNQFPENIQQLPNSDLKQNNLLTAYLNAKHLQRGFVQLVQHLAVELRCAYGSRPKGIKDADRIFEKMRKSRQIPTDMLGGKLIATNVRQMYELAGQLAQRSDVFIVQFKDRVAEPQLTNYRDLQFHIQIENHIAEIKIVHAELDAIDPTEHRIYEITRDLLNQNELTYPEQLIKNGLSDLSKRVYSELWQRILSKGDSDDSNSTNT